MNFEKAVDIVLGEEDGYSNDPNDPGGETKFGISKRSYPDLDIKNLAGSDAVGIYRRDYWDGLRCGELPRGLDFLVFDCAVNQGQGFAVRTLQGAAGVKTDGIVGPVTLAAAKNVSIAQYAALRMRAYAEDKNFDRFGVDWSLRLMRAVVTAVKDAM